jgi:hypothetical protein
MPRQTPTKQRESLLLRLGSSDGIYVASQAQQRSMIYEQLITLLVGGLEHSLFFHSVGNGKIIPTDELIFFRGVEHTNQIIIKHEQNRNSLELQNIEILRTS